MKKMTQFSLSLMMLALFAAKRGYEMDPRTGMPFNEQDVIKLNEFVEECETQKKFSKKSIRKLVKMGFEKKQVKKMCKNHNSGKRGGGRSDFQRDRSVVSNDDIKRADELYNKRIYKLNLIAS